MLPTNDEVVPHPEVDVDGVQDSKEGESPGDTVDDGLLAIGEELVDDRAEEEQVDQRPVGRLRFSLRTADSE